MSLKIFMFVIFVIILEQEMTDGTILVLLNFQRIQAYPNFTVKYSSQIKLKYTHEHIFI